MALPCQRSRCSENPKKNWPKPPNPTILPTQNPQSASDPHSIWQQFLINSPFQNDPKSNPSQPLRSHAHSLTCISALACLLPAPALALTLHSAHSNKAMLDTPSQTKGLLCSQPARVLHFSSGKGEVFTMACKAPMSSDLHLASIFLAPHLSHLAPHLLTPLTIQFQPHWPPWTPAHTHLRPLTNLYHASKQGSERSKLTNTAAGMPSVEIGSSNPCFPLGNIFSYASPRL